MISNKAVEDYDKTHQYTQYESEYDRTNSYHNWLNEMVDNPHYNTNKESLAFALASFSPDLTIPKQIHRYHLYEEEV